MCRVATRRTATNPTVRPGDASASVEVATSIRSIPDTGTSGGRLALVLAALVAIIALQAALGASPALAIAERPDATDMTNGEVYASALSEDGKTLYIGGKFTKVKEKRTDGAIIGRTVSNVAAIDVASGNLIRTWRPQVTGDGAVVRSLAVKDSRVYVGGNFTAVADGSGTIYPRKNLAAINAATASVTPFAPQVGGADSFVYALEADDSKLYAGGGFSKVDGQPRKNLAAFSLATGALDPDWKPATSKVTSCTSVKCSPKVRSLELGPKGTSIFVGGPFSYITGSDGIGDARQSVARVYTGTGDLHPWKIPDGTIAAPQTAWDLTWANGKLYAGFGATDNYVAAFNIQPGGGEQVWRYKTRGNVQTVALTPNDSRLFFGGHFGLNNLDQTVCRNKPLRGLASLDPSTGKIYCDFVPSLDQAKRPSYEGAWTLTTTRSYLWVGGGFIGVSDSINPKPAPGTGATEVPQTNLARFSL
jgi:hypothetical protein